MALNVDFAPTFLDLAAMPIPADMQGRSLVPVLRGRTPADWRTSMYYRYYHDPGDHNTRAHYGVRTRTHKLIYFWKKDQWELFDLVNDPQEMHNLYGEPGQEAVTASLKAELAQAEESHEGRRPVRERTAAERRRRHRGETAGQIEAVALQCRSVSMIRALSDSPAAQLLNAAWKLGAAAVLATRDLVTCRRTGSFR